MLQIINITSQCITIVVANGGKGSMGHEHIDTCATYCAQAQL